MVRTADTAIKTGGKNSKSRSSTTASTISPSNSSADKAYSSHNVVCHRETPTWQKPITSFFQTSNVEKPKDTTAKEPPITEDTENEIPDVVMEEEVPVSNICDINEQKTPNVEAETEMEETLFNVVTRMKRRQEEQDSMTRKKRKLTAQDYPGLRAFEKM